jgi:hypothetical protein
MSRQPRNQGPPVPSTATRQNEYFVPRDGIDREVISADICRYLGNDALVRPGHYENPQTGQVVQGYYITAYRNLTTVSTTATAVIPSPVPLLTHRPPPGHDRGPQGRLGAMGQ